MNHNLAPCFCGNENIQISDDVIVCCPNCGATHDIEDWNDYYPFTWPRK